MDVYGDIMHIDALKVELLVPESDICVSHSTQTNFHHTPQTKGKIISDFKNHITLVACSN